MEAFRVVPDSLLHRLEPPVTPVRTFLTNAIDDNVDFSENRFSWLIRYEAHRSVPWGQVGIMIKI